MCMHASVRACVCACPYVRVCLGEELTQNVPDSDQNMKCKHAEKYISAFIPFIPCHKEALSIIQYVTSMRMNNHRTLDHHTIPGHSQY